MAKRLHRGRGADRAEEAACEREYALTGARYMLRFDGRPSTSSQAESVARVDRIRTADAGELRALAVEFDCPRALQWLDQVDEQLRSACRG